MSLNRVLLPPALDPGRLTARAGGPQVLRLAGETMGTTWSAMLADPAGLDSGSVRAALETVFADVIRETSPWAPESELSAFNAAPAGSAHIISPGFAQTLAAALALAADSGGAFDPAAGGLADLWGFGPAGAVASPPAASDLERAGGGAGWRDVRFDPALRLAVQPGGVRLDLCGIAKGHAVDRCADALEALGVHDYLVEIGGEMRGAGAKPDGRPFWVRLEDPPGFGGDPLIVALHGLAVAGSGDYRRFFDHGGRRYAHTLDPVRRAPASHGVAAVSVIHPSCMACDGLATALGAMTPDAGMAFAATRGIAARIVLRTADGFEERLSPAFEALLS